MAVESVSDRQQQWALVVRRSFGIADPLPAHDAGEALVGSLEEKLRESGWQGPTRAIAVPIVEALMELGAKGDLDDRILAPEPRSSAADTPRRDAAHRLIDRGLTIVDPENLVLDITSECPPEVVVAVEQVLDRIAQYMRGQPTG